MIAAESVGASKPSLNEALGWIGSRVDDIYGTSVGRLEDVWIDPGTGAPRWLLVKESAFSGRTTLIPFEDATAAADQVWIPYDSEVVGSAPEVDAGAPLTQQVEARLRAHYAESVPAVAVPHGTRGGSERQERSTGPDRAPDARSSDEPAGGDDGSAEAAVAEPAPAEQDLEQDAGAAGAPVPGYERWDREATTPPETDPASSERRSDDATGGPTLEPDRPYRVEIRLRGGITITGELTGLTIEPSDES